MLIISRITGILYVVELVFFQVLPIKFQHISQIYKITGFDLDFSVESCNIDSAQHLVCYLIYEHNIWRDF